MLFSRTGRLYSSGLRKVALYLPDYISSADAGKAFKEVDLG